MKITALEPFILHVPDTNRKISDSLHPITHWGAVGVIVHTDIGRDGDLSGVNGEASVELARETGLQVIASGGVSSIEDVLGLQEAAGIEGVIIGRALYEGTLDLKESLDGATNAG